ncbi:MAG TPA: polysaccharide deacetylase family protein [Burkholderiales bacterium]|jgi:peptidoglycan/xylan/chitin deacetylase (PgdA/CDA1 family)
MGTRLSFITRRCLAAACGTALLAGSAQAAPLGALATPHELAHAIKPVEVHQRLVLTPEDGKTVALTLDACGGAYDAQLIDLLIRERIPATLFVTRKWLARNPQPLAVLRAHADLFQIEDHGANHVPAVIGPGRRVYGIAGDLDLAHLHSEVADGAAAISATGASAPRWYRDATAVYDPAAILAINAMGYKVAGFSLNADAGATLKRNAIIERVRRAQPGDIIIAHMNRPNGDTAEGLAAALPELLARGFRFVTLNDREVRRID